MRASVCAEVSVPKTDPWRFMGVSRESNPETDGLSSPWPMPSSVMASARLGRVRDDGHDAKSAGGQHESREDEPRFAEARDQPADQPALYECAQEPDRREGERRRSVHPSPCASRKSANVPSKAAKARTERKPIKTSRAIAGTEIVSTIPRQLEHACGLSRGLPCGSDSGRRVKTSTHARVEKAAATKNGSRSRQSSASGKLREQAPHEGPEHEAQAKRHADQAHAPRSIFGGGHVGDIGLSDQDVTPRSTVQEAAPVT